MKIAVGTLHIRSARLRDAALLAALSTQLGYPASQDEIERRLRPILRNRNHAILVAELNGKGVVGWAHALMEKALLSEPRAEVLGLIVDATERGKGIGTALMSQIEQWARAHGLSAVSLRSNVIRDQAHRFYEGLGYERVKTQHAFVKVLPKRES
ncbi:MAG TPA: GNAT family N-acetyltransferase [Terriglobia bacterium]|nr:GNAT family N-acetyltransferase [Terriglobia bacterium]